MVEKEAAEFPAAALEDSFGLGTAPVGAAAGAAAAACH